MPLLLAAQSVGKDGHEFRCVQIYGLRADEALRHHRIMRLIVPAAEVALIEVAQVKRGWRSDWRDALEEPIGLWDGSDVAEALQLIEQLPESDVYRCFMPGFGLRLHDAETARAEMLFCFHCHLALTIDLRDPSRRDVGETFDADSDPGRELLSRCQRCAAQTIA